MFPAPFFFTSYARLDDNKHTKLRDALDELRERVRGKLGAVDISQVGFFDVVDISTGSEWVTRLGEAAANCRVFVCFCSKTYFNREVCGKEFEVFRRRLAAILPGTNHRYVFPVIWDKCVLPAALGRYHIDHQGIPREYFEDGLCSLRRLRREAEYEMAIEALAKAISEAAADPHLPPGIHPIEFDSLPSAFDNPAPGTDAVSVGVLSDHGLFWQVELGQTVRSVAEEAASLERLGWRQRTVTDDIVSDVKDHGQRGDPLILIAPSELGMIWRARLTRVDGILADNSSLPCAVLVGYKSSSIIVAGSASTEATIKATLPESAAGPTRHQAFDSASASSLREALRQTISRLRMDLNARRDAARVKDTQLANAASEAGVPIDAHPVVTGPTGAL